ncbi:hypothetical protein HQ32_04490, partial [Prauserella sp. Am3]
MAGRHRREQPDREWQEFAELPPRPDPETGEPFPPHAPAYKGGDSGEEADATLSRRGILGPPNPPEGRGPALAWYRDSVASKIGDYFIAVATLVVASCFVSLFKGDPFGEALIFWQLWIIILLGAILMSSAFTFEGIFAGSDWLQTSIKSAVVFRRPRKSVLFFYDIVSISGSISGPTVYLAFEDSHGNVLWRMLHDLQKSRKVWDLFYNGIVHSVAKSVSQLVCWSRLKQTRAA